MKKSKGICVVNTSSIKKRENFILVNFIRISFLLLTIISCSQKNEEEPFKEVKLTDSKKSELLKKNGYVIRSSDSDEDGIRDDLNVFILEQCSYPIYKLACIEIAKGYTLLAYGQDVSTKERAFKRLVDAGNCLQFIEMSSNKTLDRSFESKFLDEFKKDNTERRRLASNLNEMLVLHAHWLGGPLSSARYAKGCNFYIENFENILKRMILKEDGRINENMEREIRILVERNNSFK